MRPPEFLRWHQGMFWGGHFLPHSAGNMHFCFMGTTRSGKTVSMRLLMQTTFPLIGAGGDTLDHRAIVFDFKGDMIPCMQGIDGFGTEVRSLNPFDANGCAWDIAKDIKERVHAEEMAEILVPSEQNAKQPFFGDAVRALLAGVMKVFFLTAGERWTFRDLMYAMSSPDTIIEVISRTAETRGLISTYLNKTETEKSIISTIDTKLKTYRAIAGLWDKAKESVSIKDWIMPQAKRGKPNYVIVLGYDETASTAIEAINRVILKRVTQEILQLPDDSAGESLQGIVKSIYIRDASLPKRRHWIMLDELRNLGKLDGIGKLLTAGGSKGAAVVLGIQDNDGIQDVYGEKGASEFLAMCNSFSFFRINSEKTQNWVSALLGKDELLERYTSVNSNTGWSDTGQKGFWNYGEGSFTQTVGRSVDVRLAYRDVINVLPSELGNLKFPKEHNVLDGWYFSPFTPLSPRRTTIPGDTVFSGLLNPLSSYQIVRRPSEDQELRPWTNDDLKRLWPDSPMINLKRRAKIEELREQARRKEMAILELEELGRYGELDDEEKADFKALDEERFRKYEAGRKGSNNGGNQKGEGAVDSSIPKLATEARKTKVAFNLTFED